jgi:hypothetical protein
MFCVNCGTSFDGKFCPNCGTAANGVAAQAAPAAVADDFEEVELWSGKPSGLGDKLKTATNLNGTTYVVTNQRIIIKRGLLTKKNDEIEFSKIKDFSVKQSLAERLMKVGDISIVSSDPSSPVFILENIENPDEVKELIRNAVLKFRKQNGVQSVQHV